MQKKRTANFREDETKLLIQLWGSPEIQTQLNTSHRKAPIMLQIAAAMQQHGFYRTPEEITTRIRNLKCIYHRIKKAQHMGVFGPETADWNHFPAIDAILGNNFGPPIENRGDHYSGGIKKEPNVLEAADSMYNSNSVCSGLEDDSDSGAISPMPSPMQRLTVGSSTMINPSALLGCSAIDRTKHLEHDIKRENSGAINYATHSKRYHESHAQEAKEESIESKRRQQSTQRDNDVSSLLRQLLDMEREHLELEKQRLDLDRQVGSQLLTLVPLVSSILQRHQLQNKTDSNDMSESGKKLEPKRNTIHKPMHSVETSGSSNIRSNDLVNKLFQTIPAPRSETSNQELVNVPSTAAYRK